MKTASPPLLRVLIAAAASFFAFGSCLHATSPVGDLTVTVEERPDGGVDFSLSGSTVYNHSSSFWSTPYDQHAQIPPTPDGLTSSSIQLPEGLEFLLLHVNGDPVEQDAPEATGEMAGPTRVPVRYYHRTEHVWYFSVDSGVSYASAGTPISGTGKIEAPDIPFSNFVEGSFTVQGSLFDLTYRVVPFLAPAGQARLQVPNRRRFAATAIGHSRRASVRVTNIGDAPATGVSAFLRGAGARQFRIAKRPARQIAPGRATTYQVAFRPRSAGAARARAVVASNAPTASTNLIGRGQATLAPRGPRFPLKQR